MPEEINSIASVVPEAPDPTLDKLSDMISDIISDKVSEFARDQVSDSVPEQVSVKAPDEVSDTAADQVSDKNASDKKASGKVVVSAKDSKASGRAFRVKLRGSVLALVRLPNKRSVRAAIHQLSTTGGVIHLEKPLDEKLEVEMIFHIREATIRGKVQMLFPMWATQGWMQPFRFVGLTEDGRENLDANLKSFLGEAVKGAAAGA
jgi:hypothetical protein